VEEEFMTYFDVLFQEKHGKTDEDKTLEQPV